MAEQLKLSWDDQSKSFASTGNNRVPDFAPLPTTTLFSRVSSNLIVCLSAPVANLPEWAWARAPMFRSAYFPRHSLWRPFFASSFTHAAAIFFVITISSLVASIPKTSEPIVRPDQEIIYYSKADLLPPISPAPKIANSEKAEKQAPKKATEGPERDKKPLEPPRVTIQQRQTVVSRPAVADNRRQTILQPNLPPAIIRSDVRVPNILAWNPRSDMPLPPAPDVFQPAAVARIPQLNLPRIRVAPPPMPELPTLQPLANIAKVPELSLPKMPVLPPPQEELPQTPEAFQPGTPTSNMPNLIAVNAVPPPPDTTVIRIPAGQRAGQFKASSKAATNIDNQGSEIVVPTPSSMIADSAIADLLIPHLSVSAPDVPDLPIPPVIRQTDQVRELPVAPTRRSPTMNEVSSLLAKATRPSLMPVNPRAMDPDAEYFGDRRVRTMNINMPNLSSGGGSWILRFADFNGDSLEQDAVRLESPLAIRKVDPPYAASAIREGVHGSILLRAIILRDGTVANIQILRSLDPQLDLSAITALTKWEFEPARKNGEPVDLEVLVQIPFLLPNL
ncbi:MAG: hypothetical protein A3F68_00395 [Acidobacteria bacterium RIFCSPLOWO2_12_FULL_54_10]|nr:MAG: hypothetical protein A3F68_00395 [Acidobacteria bacterium RIFCSPLOWO2_12_FULL_54_10]